MSEDTSNSGIYLVDGSARGLPIPVDGDSLTAFVGPAPRGPVDHAVEIGSAEEFLRTFGTPERHCHMEFAIRQFFANGGRNAVVVRVCGTNARNRIHLKAGEGELILQARNPGPLEYLRASVDYDGIDIENNRAFNLVIQRLRSPGSAWIDEQEYYRGVSIDPGSRDYIGYLLSQSDLVTLGARAPEMRPDETIKSCTAKQAGYVEITGEHMHSPPPSDYDLIGSAAQGTGLNALEFLLDIGQVVLLSDSEGVALGPVALLAADRFCRKHQSMLIIDPPARWEKVDDVLSDQDRSGFSSPNAISWFPGVRVRNHQGERIVTTAAGSVAAALVASDRNDGVLQLHSEGPVMLRSGTRPAVALDEHDVQRLARVGVNSLVRRSALHLQLSGNVTQARYGNISGFRNELQMHRQVLYILRRIRSGTRWTFFNHSNPDTWQELRDQISEFLAELHARSVLAGDSVADAFFVKCDSDTNKGLQGEAGQVVFVVGFALRVPGEFLTFRFQRLDGKCRIAETAWQTRHEALELGRTG